jgi:hypothetical protein
VVVGQLAGFGGETEVGDGWDFEVLDLEALRPFAFGLVLQREAQVLVLEVGEARNGGYLGVADATSLEIISIAEGLGDGNWRTEQPATSLALPSLSLSYAVEPSPFMAMMYGKTVPGRLFLYVSKKRPSPSNLSVWPKTLPGCPRCFVSHMAKPSP